MSEKETEEFIEIEESTNNDESNAPDLSSADSLRILEALLFASDELLTAARLKTILPGNPDAKQIRKMVDKLNVQFQKERHPFEIVEIGGGYQFRTVSFYHTWVRQIFKDKASKKLSVQALECLAIIAYKQPLSKAEIEAIRGVVSDGAMKTLLEKRLVTISGRSEKPGRPLLYATTQEFLKYFGLNKIADLPRIEEFEAIAREKMDDLSIDELKQPDNAEISDEEMLETSQATATSESSIDSTSQTESVQKQTPAEEPVGSQESATIAEPESTALFEINIEDNEIDENGISESEDTDIENEIDPELAETAQITDLEDEKETQENLSALDSSADEEFEASFEVSRDDQSSFEEVSADESEEVANVKSESKSDLPAEDSSTIAQQSDTANSSADASSSEEEEMLEIFLPEDNDPEKEKQ